MNYSRKVTIPLGLLFTATLLQDHQIIVPDDGPFRITAYVTPSSTATNGVMAAPLHRWLVMERPAIASSS